MNERVQAEVHPWLGCICLQCCRDQGREAQHSSAGTYPGADACMLGSAFPSTRASVSCSTSDSNPMYNAFRQHTHKYWCVLLGALLSLKALTMYSISTSTCTCDLSISARVLSMDGSTNLQYLHQTNWKEGEPVQDPGLAGWHAIM